MSKYHLYYIHKENKVHLLKRKRNKSLTVLCSVPSTSTIYDKYYDTKNISTEN